MTTDNRIKSVVKLPDTIGRNDALTEVQRCAGFSAVQYGTTTYLMQNGTTVTRWYDPVSDTELRVEAAEWMPQDAVDDLEKLDGIKFMKEGK